jgi:hypothetical protein
MHHCLLPPQYDFDRAGFNGIFQIYRDLSSFQSRERDYILEYSDLYKTDYQRV